MQVNNLKVSPFLLVIALLYISLLVISNFVGAKIANIFSFNIPTSLLFFPLIYIMNNIITEIYGFQVSKILIWSAFSVNFVVIIGCLISTYIPASSLWTHQEASEIIFRQSPRILFASLLGYLCSSFINSIILSKLKVSLLGKYFYIRVLASTSIASLVDSGIFCSLAFYNTIPNEVLLNIISLESIFKFSYELIALPIVSIIVAYVKLKEKLDVYDTTVNYNLFKVFN
ncbi:MAG: queuosine precursor transporter [Sphingobacteriia bacterium]|nr:queuosine precursor transporter [Sphingobacteriia bacterium]